MQFGKADALRVLIVGDEVDAAHALAGDLTVDGFGCEVATDGRAALALIEKDHFDVVISDVRMRGMGGIELLDGAAAPCPSFSSARSAAPRRRRRSSTARRASSRSLATWRSSASSCAKRSAATCAASRAKPRPPPSSEPSARRWSASSARSDAPRARRRRSSCAARAARARRSSRALHAMGPRRDRPFVATNVSAVPSELLESELFGHARGAFTGALIARRGLLTEADGGTLLLDEIGDMRLDLQAKLLRVLQNGEVRAVGADRARHVDVRFIAATHRDLPKMVRDGTFRHDLFFRLNVVGVTVPPLRERREDIVPLALHFLAASRARVPDSPVSSIAPDAMTALCEERWPGNVRELESAMERLVVMGESEIATRDDIQRALESEELEPRDAEDGATADAPSGKLLSLDRMIRDHVATVMKSTGGNRARAAKILGVNLSTLYRWRKSESA